MTRSVHTPHAARQNIFAVDRILMRRMGVSVQPAQADVDAWQMARLRELLIAARSNSTWYASRLHDADIASFRTRDDLARLPRTTADDVREHGLGMVCVSQDEIARVVSLDTSGTSGKPKRLFFSQDDLDRTVEFFTIGMGEVARPGDTVLALLPDARPSSVGRLLAQAVAGMGATAQTGNMALGGIAVAQQAHDAGADVLVGSPMHLRALALGWAALGLPRGRIHTALLCWDAVPRAVETLLHDILGCRVLTHWGMTETGLGGALGCGHGDGMHLREADLLVEVTDPYTGLPLPDGEWGELTVTTLCRTAMPLLRYRTGDHARLLPGPCGCGSVLRRMDRTPGRLADDVLLPSGALLPDNAVLADNPLSSDTVPLDADALLSSVRTGSRVLRLCDLDETLLPLRDIAHYTAHYAPGSVQGDAPRLSVQIYTALPPEGRPALCATAQERLRASAPLHDALITITVSAYDVPAAAGNGAEDAVTRAGLDHAKRRIVQEPAQSVSLLSPGSFSSDVCQAGSPGPISVTSVRPSNAATKVLP